MKASLLALTVFCGAAHAEFIDGNKLLNDMNGAHGFQMSALGYVMGVADAQQGVTVCAPPTVTSGQMRDMVYNYLTNTPAVRHMSGDVIVTHVLKSVWPCAERRRGTGV
ncbi:MAG: Rap1a/Tai family immunity protein [Planctomycetota bacterium]